MMKYFCKFLLRLLGWKAMDGPVPEAKCLILGVPHTSGWDFLISYLFYTSVGGKANIMVKKEFFWGPLGPLMKALGAVPVDRKHGTTVVRQMIEAVNHKEKIHLAIAPEGTRKCTANWKTGFHTIARACNIPVYMGYFDWGKKQVGRGERIQLTDDAKADLKRIQAHYRKMNLTGKRPGCFTTGDPD